MSAGASAGREDTRRLQTLRRRAYEELADAVEQAGPRLPREWLATGDPDLAALRDLRESEWKRLIGEDDATADRRAGGRMPAPGPDGSEPDDDRGHPRIAAPLVAGDEKRGREESRPLPEPPWGDPRRIRNRWLIVLALLAGSAFVVLVLAGSSAWTRGDRLASAGFTAAMLVVVWRAADASRRASILGDEITHRYAALQSEDRHSRGPRT